MSGGLIDRWTVFYQSIGIYYSNSHRWIIPSCEVKSFSKICVFPFLSCSSVEPSLCQVRIQMSSSLKKASLPCWSSYQILFFFFFFKLWAYLFDLFIYFFFKKNTWLCWVFVSVRGLSLVAGSGGHCSSRCAGLSPSRPLLLRGTGSRCAGSVIVAHGPSCSAACGIFPDQGSNPCLLHWQADSQPLRHQGGPLLPNSFSLPALTA